MISGHRPTSQFALPGCPDYQGFLRGGHIDRGVVVVVGVGAFGRLHLVTPAAGACGQLDPVAHL